MFRQVMDHCLDNPFVTFHPVYTSISLLPSAVMKMRKCNKMVSIKQVQLKKISLYVAIKCLLLMYFFLTSKKRGHLQHISQLMFISFSEIFHNHFRNFQLTNKKLIDSLQNE